MLNLKDVFELRQKLAKAGLIKRTPTGYNRMLEEERHMRRLSPLQRAYLQGYRCAQQKMRRELDQMARRLDDELAELADEMQDMRNEFYRLKAVEEAVAVERDPDVLLN